MILPNLTTSRRPQTSRAVLKPVENPHTPANASLPQLPAGDWRVPTYFKFRQTPKGCPPSSPRVSRAVPGCPCRGPGCRPRPEPRHGQDPRQEHASEELHVRGGSDGSARSTDLLFTRPRCHQRSALQHEPEPVRTSPESFADAEPVRREITPERTHKWEAKNKTSSPRPPQLLYFMIELLVNSKHVVLKKKTTPNISGVSEICRRATLSDARTRSALLAGTWKKKTLSCQSWKRQSDS